MVKAEDRLVPGNIETLGGNSFTNIMSLEVSKFHGRIHSVIKLLYFFDTGETCMICFSVTKRELKNSKYCYIYSKIWFK